MLKTQLVGGTGKSIEAQVSDYNALSTHVLTAPLQSIGTKNRMVPFVTKIDLHNGGTDGSVTPVDYTLLVSDASSEFDYYVQSIVLVISDGTQNYSKYGAIAALTNGVDLYSTIRGDIDYIMEGAKTGGEVLIWAAMDEIFPTNPAIISGWSTNDDALVSIFDIKAMIPGTGGLSGLRIGRGTKDSLTFTVNDNLTALSDHFIFVKGFKLYE